MARDILGEYGAERSIRSRGSNQGRTQRDVNKYQPPQGPNNINDPKSPSLHGDGQSGMEYCGLQNESGYSPQTSKGPGLGGDSPRPAGSQGRR